MLRTRQLSPLPSAEWRQLFFMDHQWIVRGGTFWELEVSPPEYDQASDPVDDDAYDKPEPIVTIEPQPSGFRVAVFLPMPEHRGRCRLAKLRRAHFSCRGSSLWSKRCASNQEVVWEVSYLFTLLQSSWSGRKHRDVSVVPELVDLANAIYHRFPDWLNERSQPFGFLDVIVNGVCWSIRYDDAQEAYSLDCMGYCDSWNGKTRMRRGPSCVPRWLFSRSAGMAEASFEYADSDGVSTATFRDAGQIIDTLAALQFRLQADLVTSITSHDS